MNAENAETGLQLCEDLGMPDGLESELTEILNDYEETQLYKRVCRILKNAAMRKRATFDDIEMLQKIIKEEISWQK